MSHKPLTDAELKELHRIERARMAASTRTQQSAVGDRAVALQKRVEVRREEDWRSYTRIETKALAEGRGEAVEEGAQGQIIRKHVLERLKEARVITPEEAAAGAKYGLTWQRLYANGLIRSNLAESGGGSSELDPLDARIKDLVSLTRARGLHEDMHGRIVDEGLRGDARLIKLCDDICGRGLTLREAIGSDTRKRRRFRILLKQALGQLALYYGYLKTREDEQMAA